MPNDKACCTDLLGRTCFVVPVLWYLLCSAYGVVCDTWRVLNDYIGHEVQNFNER